VLDQQAHERVVLADVGGTNVRFAVLRDCGVGVIEHMAVSSHAQFSDALAAFMSRQPDSAAIHHALFAVAGIVEDQRCALTNNRWVVDAAELSARLGFADVRLINDFEAVAWALPRLASSDLRQIGGGEPKPRAPMVVVGPGTGLGVAAYVPSEPRPIVLRSEGGHATVPSGSLREDAIIESLRRQFGHVSAERVLSGGGLENLYKAIAAIESAPVPKRNAAAILEAAVSETCATSLAALETFCALLGEIAGNLALTFEAAGGVFIAGGITPHLRDYLPKSGFRSRFEAKGRITRHLQKIPTHLILHEDPAFLGLQSLAQQHTWVR
jgi:glucokinase